jgi:AraC family transcriptional regulator, L-rhamnose operon regulatory protein RhaS
MHIRNLTQKLDISYVLKDSWHLPVHKHTHFELQYIMRGQGQHAINDQSYTYEKGDLFIMGPNDHHFFIFQERTAICFIKFHEGFFGEYLQNTDFRQVLTRFSSPYRKITLSADTRQQVIQLIDLLIGEHRKQTAYTDIVIKSSLTLVLAIMAKNSDQLLVKPKGEKIQSILSYIDSHITARHLLTTEKIADAFFISKGYFNQYFHKATGSPYKKYVNGYSLNLIAQQLVNTDKTLLQLAGEFGYSDESHLSNAFKAHFRQTPSSFKRERQRT